MCYGAASGPLTPPVERFETVFRQSATATRSGLGSKGKTCPDKSEREREEEKKRSSILGSNVVVFMTLYEQGGRSSASIRVNVA